VDFLENYGRSLFAHQAVQDSYLVADDEVNAKNSDAQIEQFGFWQK